jgi:transglutaminase-like putative cysteine protease
VSASAGALGVKAPAAAPAAARAWRLRPRAPAAFAALALLAGLRFAALLAHPPALRVLAIVAAATLAGGALAASAKLAGHARLALAARLAILALCGYVSLRAAGTPARLSWPWRWPALAHELARGIDALDGLWPYTGHAARARLAVMLVLPAAIVPAAALAFWPRAGRARELRGGALALLLGLYAAAAANQARAGWQVQGLLLLVLVALWGWAWGERRADGPRALAWLAVLACLALLGATLAATRSPLLDYRAWNPFGPALAPARFDWNQRYGPLSWPNSSETMVQVAAPRPQLWRVSALDRFDGVGFMRSAAPPPGTSGLAGIRLRAQWLERATYTVRGLSSAQLLSPGTPVALDGAAPALRARATLAADGTLSVAGATPAEGERYTVTAYAPRPSAAELRSAPRGYPAAYAPYLALELPGSRAGAWSATAGEPRRIEESPYGGVYVLARRLAAGAPSAYDVVARVEGFLRSGFRYDESPPRLAYPLAGFLLAVRAGYCEQFAGAMALMLRMDGLPARVVAGFQPGTRNRASGLYEVSARDAHEWVEVFFAGIGWVAFDPTPAAPAAGGLPAGLAPTALSVSGAGASAGSGEGTLKRRPTRSRARPAADAARAHAAAGPALAVWIAAGLAGALALALALRVLSRRLDRALAGSAEGAIVELSRALARIGGGELAPGTTLAELERRLELSHGSGASRYVRLLRERRYAPAADARAPWARERRALRRALCAGRGPILRLRALLALPPAASWAPARARGRSRRAP